MNEGQWHLTTVQIYYWLPDYKNIIQEFTWQTVDHIPKFPRIHKFLNYWHDNIDAIIEQIYLSHYDSFGKQYIVNGFEFKN